MDRAVHLANHTFTVAGLVSARLDPELSPGIIEHFRHEHETVHGAVRVKRRHDLGGASDPQQVSLTICAPFRATRGYRHSVPPCGVRYEVAGVVLPTAPAPLQFARGSVAQGSQSTAHARPGEPSHDPR